MIEGVSWLTKWDSYFWVSFVHFWSKCNFKAAGTVSKIGWSLKPNHYKLIKPTYLSHIGGLGLSSSIVIFSLFMLPHDID